MSAKLSSEKYTDDMYGVLNSLDRVVISGNVKRSAIQMANISLIGIGMYPKAGGSETGTIAVQKNLDKSRVFTQNDGRCHPPSVLSRCWATAKAVSSRQGRATTWTPMGNPSGEVPPRKTTLGHPVRL